MSKIARAILAGLSRTILEKHKPKVVGITGSVGKTSAKEAVYAVLASKYIVRRNVKNYNNEFGLPLTIIGAHSPGKNPLKWLGVFLKGIWVGYFFSSYPEVLVLEMGVDRPGDMEYLLKIVRPQVGIITTIGLSHVEFFKSPDHILEEKGKLLKAVPRNGFAIINEDDQRLVKYAPQIKADIVTFGSGKQADVRLLESHATYSPNNKSFGTLIHVSYKGVQEPIFLNEIIGLSHVQACLAGICAGLAFGLGFHDVAKAITSYRGEAGRLRIIPGIRESAIIDDTYNSSPQSAELAVNELENFPADNKIAILGDMLELGEYAQEEHRKIAEFLMDAKINTFVAVGELSKLTAEELVRFNFPEKDIFLFENSKLAAQKASELMTKRCAVLVKGSQGMRMERVVKAVMADPEDSKKLLTRQDKSWLKKNR